ncbi:MAG TPA: glycosyltransferase family 39 protein [bacterium]|nr:glycosyltransferase family 39 protein [bacterium]HPN29978.1 glycosyltransferase family 39 protein [bacterium]
MKNRKLILTSAVIAAVYLICQILWIVFTKRFQPPVLFPFIAVLFTLAVYSSAGYKIIQPANFKFEFDEFLIISLITGTLLNVIIIFFLSILKIFSIKVYLIFFIIQIFLFPQFAKKFFSGIIRLYGNSSIYAVLPLAVFLSLIMFLANTPNVFYDVQTYHLAIPQKIVLNGSFPLEKYNSSFFYPPAFELINSFFLSTGLDYRLPQSFNVIVFIFIIISAAMVSKNILRNQNGLTPVFICLTIPSLCALAAISKNDILTGLLQINSIYFFIKFINENDKKYLLALIIINSLGLWTKYTYYYFFAAQAIAFILFLKCGESRIRNILCFLGLPFIIAAPLLIKNFLICGNPFYPHLVEIFGYGEYLKNGYMGMEKFGDRTFMDYILIPYDIFVNPASFGSFFDLLSDVGSIGFPFIFGLILFAFKSASSLKKNLYLITFFILIYAFWIFTSVAPRFIIGAIIFLYVFSASYLEKKFSSRKFPLTFFYAALVFGMLYSFVTLYYKFDKLFDSATFIFYNRSETEYLKRFPLYNAASFINSNISKNETALAVGETTYGFFKTNVITGSASNKTIIIEWIRECGMDEKKFLLKIKQFGVKYILINIPELNRLAEQYEYLYWTESESTFFRNFISNYGKKTYDDSGIIIYAV